MTKPSSEVLKKAREVARALFNDTPYFGSRERDELWGDVIAAAMQEHADARVQALLDAKGPRMPRFNSPDGDVTFKTCTTCEGSGAFFLVDRERKRDCPTCGGAGQIPSRGGP